MVPFGRAVHLLELELLHPRLVGRDGRAFDGDADPLGRFRGVDRDLVAGLVALLDAEVEIEELDVEIGMDQLVLDQLPDDAGHLVAVHLDDRILHLDLRHCGRAFVLRAMRGRGGAGMPGLWRGRGVPARTKLSGMMPDGPRRAPLPNRLAGRDSVGRRTRGRPCAPRPRRSVWRKCPHGERSRGPTAAAAARCGRRCSSRSWSAGRCCATPSCMRWRRAASSSSASSATCGSSSIRPIGWSAPG